MKTYFKLFVLSLAVTTFASADEPKCENFTGTFAGKCKLSNAAGAAQDMDSQVTLKQTGCEAMEGTIELQKGQKQPMQFRFGKKSSFGETTPADETTNTPETEVQVTLEGKWKATAKPDDKQNEFTYVMTQMQKQKAQGQEMITRAVLDTTWKWDNKAIALTGTISQTQGLQTASVTLACDLK